jgi:AbrB family looped-hinge helix DNA binding protein
MPEATITSKGQITIPKPIRSALELEPGDRVVFVLRDDGVVEMKPENVDVMALCGIVKPKKTGVSLADMDRAIRKAASRR